MNRCNQSCGDSKTTILCLIQGYRQDYPFAWLWLDRYSEWSWNCRELDSCQWLVVCKVTEWVWDGMVEQFQYRFPLFLAGVFCWVQHTDLWIPNGILLRRFCGWHSAKYTFPIVCSVGLQLHEKFDCSIAYRRVRWLSLTKISGCILEN